MMKIKSNLMEAQTGTAGKVMPTALGGRVRVASGTVVPAAAAPAGTVLELVKIPKDARILPASQIHFEAGQNSDLTVKVGDAAKSDRYLPVTTVGGGNKTLALDGGKFTDYILPGEMTVFATTGGAELAAGKKIVFDILYVVD